MRENLNQFYIRLPHGGSIYSKPKYLVVKLYIVCFILHNFQHQFSQWSLQYQLSIIFKKIYGLNDSILNIAHIPPNSVHAESSKQFPTNIFYIKPLKRWKICILLSTYFHPLWCLTSTSFLLLPHLQCVLYRGCRNYTL